MSSTMKNNYKAKWLQALHEKGLESGSVTDASKVVDTAVAVTVNASLESKHLQDVILDCATATSEMITVLGEYRRLGPLMAPDISDEIDVKLHKLPLKVIIRRTRDVIRVSNGRIALLSEAQNLLLSQLDDLTTRVKTLERSNMNLQKQLIEQHHIGKSPEESEIQAMLASTGSKSAYQRFGLSYHNLDTDSIEQNLTLHRIEESSSSDEDDDHTYDEDDLKLIMPTRQNGRGKVSIPKNFLDDV